MHDEYQTYQFWNNMKKSELKNIIKEEFKASKKITEAEMNHHDEISKNLYKMASGGQEPPKSQNLNQFRKPKGGLYSFNDKEIDSSSIELEDVFKNDHPDYSDAYVSYAEYVDGTPLTQDELADLNDIKGNDIVQDKIFG